MDGKKMSDPRNAFDLIYSALDAGKHSFQMHFGFTRFVCLNCFG